MGGDDESFDLEGIVQAICRPIRDDTSEEVLSAFLNRIVDLIGPRLVDAFLNVMILKVIFRTTTNPITLRNY